MSFLISCSQSKRTVVASDFCELYEPLRKDLPTNAVIYWQTKVRLIQDKEEDGRQLTGEEEFLREAIENIARNDAKYESKGCDED